MTETSRPRIKPVPIPDNDDMVCLMEHDGVVLITSDGLRLWLTRGKGTRLDLIYEICDSIQSDKLLTNIRGLHIQSGDSDMSQRLYFFEARTLTRVRNVFTKPPYDGIGIFQINKEAFEIIGGRSGTQERCSIYGLDLTSNFEPAYEYPWKKYYIGDPALPPFLIE